MGIAIAAITASAFLLLCLFQGSGVNLALFAMGWGLLLVAVSLSRPSRIALALAASPIGAVLVLLVFVALALSYQLSLSKDNSFAPALGLAVCPLAFVIGRALGSYVELALALVSAVVLGLAIRSAGLLLVGNSEGVLWPFLDANAYSALCYLVLIPWFHYYLTQRWCAEKLALPVHIGVYLGAFVLLMAAFGAQSRGALVILLVATAIWFGLALANRRSWRPVALLVVVALAAFSSVGFFGSLDLGGEFAPEQVAEGISVRGALVAASLNMLEIRPLWGVGVFVFPLLYRRYRLEADQETVGLYAHNDYLQVLIECGVLGLLLLVAFAAVVGWRFLRGLKQQPGDPGFANLGAYIALGAALAHSIITFIFYVPPLALVLGLLAAAPLRRCQQPSVAVLKGKVDPRYLNSVVVLVLLFGWSCFAYLAVDTYTAGVLGGQQGIPGASEIRANPRSALRYAEIAERLNGQRGIPILAQARLMEERLNSEPESKYLQERTLGAYRRTMEVDPWNPQSFVYMFGLLETHPQLRPYLREHENPGWLLAQALSVDPRFPPAIDAILAQLINANREPDALEFLKGQVMPWLKQLSRENPEAAIRYFRMLEAWANKYQDDQVLQALEDLRRS